MTTTQRPVGRQRDPHTDRAAVDAVLDLISTGATLSGLSLVAIAEHAGVSRNSLYRRWKTKDELYLDVLAAISTPLPEFDSPTAVRTSPPTLTYSIARALDHRASSMSEPLPREEAATFPELHRRYFAEIDDRRRESMYQMIRRGIANGEIRPDIDVALVNQLLVSPILARMSSGATHELDPNTTSRSIVEAIYNGIQTR